jgi:hypothetical protein
VPCLYGRVRRGAYGCTGKVGGINEQGRRDGKAWRQRFALECMVCTEGSEKDWRRLGACLHFEIDIRTHDG